MGRHIFLNMMLQTFQEVGDGVEEIVQKLVGILLLHVVEYNWFREGKIQ